ncbi:MAG: CDP-alcohol phosphatidyltransferase family protein, partial [Actinomycetota bacterium]|nr:CDP-alcohol phosphatidyltransferase family protein [Actinomycetota bacterium]
PRGRRTAAVVAGVAIGLLVIVKALDMGFFAILDRPFEPVSDWSYFGPGLGVLGDSIGGAGAVAVAIGASVLVIAVLTLMPVAVVRMTGLVAHHRRVSWRVLTGLAVVWVLSAVSGLQAASTSAAGTVYDVVSQVRADLADRETFEREIADDDFAGTPDDQLLTALRGKDVLLVFVESYGRVAVEDPDFSPRIVSVLEDGTRRLRAAGYASRSAFLTSPTFGAASWLAHSTLQSGLWVDSEGRYGQLLDAERLTLTDAFGRAGWRTVFDVPANTEDWPEGEEFYGFDQMYDSRNVGYQGPEFGYASMPDQYTLAELRRRELTDGPDRRDVMAEVDLVSSHHPWTPLPRLVDWDAVGDGSVFAGMPEEGEPKGEVFGDPDKVRTAYGRSIEYSLDTVFSFLETYPDPDLVVVMLGDHQPHTYVTGADPGHDVPISVIAQDAAVLDRIAGWGYQDGMHPDPDAPVWPMDDFRDRFLTAFGPRS